MSTLIIGIGILAAFVIGIVAGAFGFFFFRGAVMGRRYRIAERKAARIEAEARIGAKQIVDEAKQESEKTKAIYESEYRQRKGEIQRQENRLSQKLDSLDRKLENLEHRDRQLNNREKEIDTIRNNITELRDKQIKKLEEISQMSTSDAKNILLENMKAELKEEAARRIREWELIFSNRLMKKLGNIIPGHPAFGIRNCFRNYGFGRTDSQ